MAMRQDASTGQMVDDKSEAPAEDPKHPKIYVKVYAPFKVYFEGKAESLTATNETGPFDILPHHHNFICMLLPGNITIKTSKDEKTVIKISRAVLHVKADKAIVFLDV